MRELDVHYGLYVSNRAALIEYATPILGSREAAEDIVQDAFLKFFPSMGNGLGTEHALAYLYRIVRNLSFDVLKRRKVEKRVAKDDGPFWALPQMKPTPEESLLLGDHIKIVSEILASLPLEVRVAAEMHRFGGFTLEEVAEHLDISVATAHRHVRTAILRIAMRIERDNI